MGSGPHLALTRNRSFLKPSEFVHFPLTCALALLYSAAVIHIDSKFSCDILESDTEGECIKKTGHIDIESRNAFREITRIWLRLAYANRKPSDEIFESALLRFEKHIATP